MPERAAAWLMEPSESMRSRSAARPSPNLTASKMTQTLIFGSTLVALA